MKNEWIIIDGKKVLWDEFIYALDDYRFRIKRKYGPTIHGRFCAMIFPLQEMADIYHNRLEDWPNDYVLEEMEKQGFPRLKTDCLPEAITEAYDQMKNILNIDLGEMLSKCEKKSKAAYENKLAKEEKEHRRQAEAKKLATMVRNQYSRSEMDFLVELQKAKESAPAYETSEKEWQVTELLCQIIVCKIAIKCVPYDVLDKAYDLELVERDEINELLKANGYSFDYKCYRTDFVGDSLYAPTIIPLDIFCQICRPRVEQVLGCEVEI